MGDETRFEKPPPTAPPPYTETYLTGNPQPPPQYGFQQPIPGYPQGYPYGYVRPEQVNQLPPQTVQPISTTQQTVVIMGGCPSCRVGVLEDNYTCCGILCAICFFPLGILCCLAMKEKRCTNCHATF